MAKKKKVKYVPEDQEAHDFFLAISEWGQKYMPLFKWPDLGAIREYLTRIHPDKPWTFKLEKRILSAASRYGAHLRKQGALRAAERKIVAKKIKIRKEFWSRQGGLPL